MDKKKLSILIIGILLFLSLILVIFIFMTKDKKEEVEGGESNKEKVDIVLDIEEELKYSKDSLLDTASKEIKELEGTISTDEDYDKELSTDKEGNEDVDNGNVDNSNNNDYSNFFDQENSKEIAEVKKTNQNPYDNVKEISKDFDDYYNSMEKLKETALSLFI